MTDLKGVLAEWVLTNGTLPGFEDRLTTTLPMWSTVGADGMTVYRGQGGVIGPPEGTSAKPNELVAGVRPLLATSTKLDAVMRYAGDDCCLYQITLSPGVRYVDIAAVLTFTTKEGKLASGVKNVELDKIAAMCKDWDGKWPRSTTPAGAIRPEVIKRCTNEDEILVYANRLTFSKTRPIDSLTGSIKSFAVTLTPSSGGSSRGRTFRRKTLRRNKNGRRLTRQPKRNVRDGYARNR